MRAAERDITSPIPPSPLGEAEAAGLLAPLAGERRLALAVSGGPDSTALMLLAARWLEGAGAGRRITVLSVDHGLRPGSADEVRQVAGWAHRLGLNHEGLRWEGEKPVSNIQQAARQARYRLMAQACLQRGIQVLVTGHHLEDQAETFLLRLARGSGVDGLGAMAERTALFGITVARPLLDVARDRLTATLDAAGHDFITDPSNDDGRFARVRMRALAARLAREGLDARRLAATARRLRQARLVLDAAATDLARRCARLDPAGYCTIDPGPLLAAPEDTAMRLLSRALGVVGGNAYPPRRERLEALYAALAAGEAVRTLAGCRVAMRAGRILLWREEGRQGLGTITLEPGGVGLWDGRFVVRSRPDGPRAVKVRALGAGGWRHVRRTLPRALPRTEAQPLPAAIGRTFISFWDGDRLIGAPHAGDAAALGGLEARFVGSLEGGAGPVPVAVSR